ncbi:N-acetylmuramoyl-L-alanine amidase [Christensenellaceae bacterium OttesenSCG-928-K19]|nr:N-acetylmuramoyl-L-alanine amidase [Christensenellaceae bacterium OttesenSCG-928-K19]
MKQKLFLIVLLCMAALMLLVSCTQNEPQEQMAEQTVTPELTPAPTPTPTPTATPTPTPSPTPTPTPDLKTGVTHEAVKELQSRLKELGYLKIEETTEYYGPATQTAVRLFQRQNGLDADGIAGDATRELLYSGDAKECVAPLAGILIGLDPGHQGKGSSSQEPTAPGSGETKARVTSGTAGVSSRVDEHVVNLQVGLKLRDLLEEQGATVLMMRETADVDISNSERALMMNEAGTDLVLRLHCNGSDNSSDKGAFILVPSGGYTEGIQAQSLEAAEYILAAFIDATGANNMGVSKRSDQTGFNWSTVPVCNIEMGHMSNPTEDELLVSDEYQNKCARGLCNGIVRYFESK